MSVDAQPGAPIAGFWRRLVALFVDSLLLGVIGWALGVFFFDSLAHLGGYGRFVGFAIALSYFGALNSRIGRGQTIGKLLLGVRVVQANGESLTLSRSMLRYVVLGVPFFLNGAPIDTISLPIAWSYVLALLVFGGMLSISYLYLFNRRTRQSLHDLAVGSYVARAEPNDTFARPMPIWRGHVVVAALIAVASLSAPLFGERLAQSKTFAGLLTLQATLQHQPHVRSASVNYMKKFGRDETLSVASTILLDTPVIEDKAFATNVARLILADYPPARTCSSVVVKLTYGYDIGIATGWTSAIYRFNPDDVALK